MKIEFIDIPEETKIILFDDTHHENSEAFTVPEGSTTIEFDVPQNWLDPHYQIRTVQYFFPNSRARFQASATEIKVTGADYYLDISNPDTEIEQNWNSVESLIHSITRSGLDSRQKFYTSLMSLNSYFEYLVHSMLVRSGHMSKRGFKGLGNHENRIDEAFDDGNTSFLDRSFTICPGKSVDDLPELTSALKGELKAIMNDIRKLRNDVAHKWGYQEIPQQRISEVFTDAGIQLPYTQDPEEFHEAASNHFIAIWAKVKNPLNTRFLLISEREAIQKDRVDRGYS